MASTAPDTAGAEESLPGFCYRPGSFVPHSKYFTSWLKTYAMKQCIGVTCRFTYLATCCNSRQRLYVFVALGNHWLVNL